jgi:hypothetical protein
MDYERIRTAMQAVDWRWGLGEQAAVPTVQNLRECVEDLSNEARMHPGGRIASGGFEALYTNGRLRVTFVLGEVEETTETVVPDQPPVVALGD